MDESQREGNSAIEERSVIGGDERRGGEKTHGHHVSASADYPAHLARRKRTAAIIRLLLVAGCASAGSGSKSGRRRSLARFPLPVVRVPDHGVPLARKMDRRRVRDVLPVEPEGFPVDVVQLPLPLAARHKFAPFSDQRIGGGSGGGGGVMECAEGDDVALALILGVLVEVHGGAPGQALVDLDAGEAEGSAHQ